MDQRKGPKSLSKRGGVAFLASGNRQNQRASIAGQSTLPLDEREGEVRFRNTDSVLAQYLLLIMRLCNCLPQSWVSTSLLFK
jgi:hypothetical protein